MAGRVLRAVLMMSAMVAGVGCYSTFQPPCGFLCGTDGSCPDNYACANDGVCHRSDTDPNLVCFDDAALGSEPRPIDAMAGSDGPRPIDAKDIDARPIDAKPIDAKPIDAKAIDAPPIDAKPIDAKPIDAPPIDAKPIDAPPPIDAKPIDAPPPPPPIDAAPIDAGSGSGSGTGPFDAGRPTPGSPLLRPPPSQMLGLQSSGPIRLDLRDR